MVVNIDAIVVVDMINVFVSGKMGSERYRDIPRNIKDTIVKLNKITFLVQDSHVPTDPEIKIWGPHAMAGSFEAETVPELKGMGILIKKNTYDAFFNTDLEDKLKEVGASNVLFCGLVTDICLQNTVASAFFRGFNPIIVKECTDSVDDFTRDYSLSYMERIYGAKIISKTDIS